MRNNMGERIILETSVKVFGYYIDDDGIKKTYHDTLVVHTADSIGNFVNYVDYDANNPNVFDSLADQETHFRMIYKIVLNNIMLNNPSFRTFEVQTMKFIRTFVRS